MKFSLPNKTTVQQKSMHITNQKLEIGEAVKIAYNPDDLKEVYLLD